MTFLRKNWFYFLFSTALKIRRLKLLNQTNETKWKQLQWQRLSLFGWY